jgi:hypothetical protein
MVVVSQDIVVVDDKVYCNVLLDDPLLYNFMAFFLENLGDISTVIPRNTSGSNVSMPALNTSSFVIFGLSVSAWLGSGSPTVGATDYSLQSPTTISAPISLFAVSNVDVSTVDISISFSVSISEQITIQELGLIGYFYYLNTSNGNIYNTGAVLLTHDVLPQPVSFGTFGGVFSAILRVRFS